MGYLLPKSPSSLYLFQSNFDIDLSTEMLLYETTITSKCKCFHQVFPALEISASLMIVAYHSFWENVSPFDLLGSCVLLIFSYLSAHSSFFTEDQFWSVFSAFISLFLVIQWSVVTKRCSCCRY